MCCQPFLAVSCVRAKVIGRETLNVRTDYSSRTGQIGTGTGRLESFTSPCHVHWVADTWKHYDCVCNTMSTSVKNVILACLVKYQSTLSSCVHNIGVTGWPWSGAWERDHVRPFYHLPHKARFYTHSKMCPLFQTFKSPYLCLVDLNQLVFVSSEQFLKIY